MDWNSVSCKAKHHFDVFCQTFKSGDIETSDIRLYSLVTTEKRHIIMIVSICFMCLNFLCLGLDWNFLGSIFVLFQLFTCFVYCQVIATRYRFKFTGNTIVTALTDESILALKIYELTHKDQITCAEEAHKLMEANPEIMKPLIKEFREFYLVRIM